MHKFKLWAAVFLAVCSAAEPTLAQTSGDVSPLLSQKWTCTVSSAMRGDLNFRLYTGGGMFNGTFVFALAPAAASRIGGVIVAEKWTSGALTVTEFAVNGISVVNPQGQPAVVLERLTVTRSNGDQRVWPAFNQMQLNLGPYGKIWAEVDVGRGGDVATGNCRAG
jgi:hypothetical protein